MTPDQLLYDYLFQKSLESGYKTYDYLPLENDNVPYPFVIIGGVQIIPDADKSSVSGQLTVSVDVWGSSEQRFEVSKMMNDLFFQASQPFKLMNCSVFLIRNSSDMQIIQDTSVPNIVLNHGILSLVFNFS